MKVKFLLPLLAAGAIFAASFAFSGCSAQIGYVLNTAEDGSKYYTASVSGFSSAMEGELEVPAYYGEGEERYPVKEIADSGFSGTSLTKITLPSTIEKIGTAAFSYNTNLKEVEFAADSPISEITHGAFGYCPSLERVVFPASAKIIGGLCFFGCTALSEVTLPDSLEEIYSNAFQSCENLKSVHFPQGLVRIGTEAFYGCTSLEEVILPDAMHDIERETEDENGKTETVTLPAIGYGAFYGCTGLKTAKVGAGITCITEAAFGYCTSLQTLYLPAGLKEVRGVLYDGASAIMGHAFCLTDLKTVYFGGSEEEWKQVAVNNEPLSANGITLNNSPLLSAEIIYNSPYPQN